MRQSRLLAFVWGVGAFLMLTGCAATGASYQSVSQGLPTLKASDARIYFYRSASMVGAAIQPEILLDNQVVGRSQPGGFFYVDTRPGRHWVAAQTEDEGKLELDVQPGETVYVASSISFGVLVGRVQLTLQPPAQAVADLSSLSYTGSAPIAARPMPVSVPPASPLPGTSGRARGPVSMADLDALLPAAVPGGVR